MKQKAMKRKVTLEINPRYAACALVMSSISFATMIECVQNEGGLIFQPEEVARMQQAMDDLFVSCASQLLPEETEQCLKVIKVMGEIS